MKKLKLILMSLTLSAFMAFSAWAGEWKQDAAGWRYDSGDSVYLNGGWQWIDGKCYYFTPEGYCLTNTTTPDGNTVDSSGAWIIGGVVQTQVPDTTAQADTGTQADTTTQAAVSAQVYTIGNLSFSIPDGYSLFKQDEDGYVLASSNQMHAIYIGRFDFGENVEAYLSMDGINYILDQAMVEALGVYDSKSVRQLVSGTWLRYDYDLSYIEDFTGFGYMYVRLKGTELQGVIFVGDYSNVDLDGIINTIIK